MLNQFKKVLLSAALLGAIVGQGLTARPAMAAGTTSNANIFWPAVYSSYLSVNGSQTLQPLRYAVGANFHFAKNPLELSGGRGSIINSLLIGDFYGGLGITDWWQVSVGVPVAFYEDFNDPSSALTEKSLQMMDVRLESKIRLLDLDRHPLGLAVQPFVFFPTGKGSRFVGNDSFAGGVLSAVGMQVIADTNIKNRVQLAANVGYLMKKRDVILGTEQDDMLIFGLGANVRTTNWLDVIGEVHGNANATNLFGRRVETPLEADGGLRFHLAHPDGMAVTVGGGVGLGSGFGEPAYRAIVALSYPNPKVVDLALPPPPAAPQEEVLAKVENNKIVIMQPIHFEFNMAVIRPISYPILDAVVNILKSREDISKVRVEGHTDSKGTDAYNNRLSQARADAVKKYLTNQGIEVSRLVAIGYGESRPIDTNTTEEGRAKNRRVEFTILDQGQ